MSPVSARTRKATNDSARTNDTAKDDDARPPPNKKAATTRRAPAKNAAAKGKGKGKGQGKRLAEDEEEDDVDSGRNGSKEFLRQASESKRRKINGSIAKEDIQKGLEEFLQMLDQEPENGSARNMADQLREHLPSKLADIMIYKSDSRDLPKCSSLDPALAILCQMSTTIQTYDSLSEAAPIARPDWMEWSQDHTSLVSLNEHALRIAARQIDAMVIPGKKMAEMPQRVNDIEELAWEVLEESRPKNLESTWGALAKAQFMAFLGLLGMGNGS